MENIFVEQFISEVKGFEKDISEEKILELKVKIDKLFDAVGSRDLIIHDSGTYAMLFIDPPGPIYLHTFFQYKSALKILLSFIEKEEYFFRLKDLDLLEIVKYIALLKVDLNQSLDLFQHFFQQEKEEQERILYTMRSQRIRFSEEGIERYRGLLFETIDEEISYVSGLLQDLKSDGNLYLLFGMEKDIFEERITALLAEKSAEKAMLKMKNQIKENLEQVNAHLGIFKPHGFMLFDYLMKNHLSSGFGWQSDLSFFFRMMNERDRLIYAKQNKFREFLDLNYPHLEPMGKFKVWNDINSEKRNKIYLSAKNAIGLK